MNKNYKLLIVSTLVFLVILCLGVFNIAHAQVTGVYIPTSSETGLSDKNLQVVIMTFMKWLLALVSFIAVIAFAVSGIQYMTAAGSEKSAETAKRNMTYSIIGVIVALLSLVIVQTVVNLLK